jgi:hypothetical protein
VLAAWSCGLCVFGIDRADGPALHSLLGFQHVPCGHRKQDQSISSDSLASPWPSSGWVVGGLGQLCRAPGEQPRHPLPA